MAADPYRVRGHLHVASVTGRTPDAPAAGARVDVHTWDAVGTAAAIAAGEVSALEVVDAAIARAEKVDPEVAGIVTETFERARATARAGVTGPLAGVPTFVKDLDDVAGVPTGHGSRAFRGVVATRTAASVEQHLGTGLVSLGKSAAPEFGLTATTEPMEDRPTRNPWDTSRTAGGSSGGAAALVASGVVPVAHATDGGGSIRIPAAVCGLVGLKPTYGRMVELERMQGLPVKIAVHGIVARTVRDVAAYHAAAERVAPSPAGLPPIGHVHGPAARTLRVGVVTSTPTGARLDPEVVEATEHVGRLLEEAGHRVVDVDPPVDARFEDDFLLYWSVLAAGIRLVGLQTVGRSFDPDLLDPFTRGLAANLKRHGHRVPAALARLRRLRADVAAAQHAAGVDVLVTPVVAIPPPPIGHLDVSLPYDTHIERVKAFVQFTPVQNVTGAPAVSVPAAVHSDGTPIGVQVAGLPGADRDLLELAYTLEEAIGWEGLAPAFR